MTALSWPVWDDAPAIRDALLLCYGTQSWSKNVSGLWGAPEAGSKHIGRSERVWRRGDVVACLDQSRPRRSQGAFRCRQLTLQNFGITARGSQCDRRVVGTAPRS